MLRKPHCLPIRDVSASASIWDNATLTKTYSTRRPNALPRLVTKTGAPHGTSGPLCARLTGNARFSGHAGNDSALSDLKIGIARLREGRGFRSSEGLKM
jgi:hypothetical protein